MIEVKNLTKLYGMNVAVDNVSFVVEAGHVYGFLGPNGAGKSTTMNIICGCLSATEGQVLIDGVDIYDEPLAVRKKIGYLPEIPPLYKDMTPNEYLRFVAGTNKVENVDKEIKRVSELTSIRDVGNRLIRNLSKGYRQRVGIAQALIGDPDIIILDEPTVGLDPVQIVEIRSLIRSLGADHTVIISSHILSEISATCDHVIVISHGRIVADDSLENIDRNLGEREVLTVEARADEEKMKRCLSGVAGISNISSSASPYGTKLEIEVEKGSDIRESVFNAFVAAKIPLVRLSSDSMTLEQIFLKLINEEHIASDSDKAASSGEISSSKPRVSDPSTKKSSSPDDSPYYERKPKKQKNTIRDEEYAGYYTLFGNPDDTGKEDK